jgi:hypothetical protein
MSLSRYWPTRDEINRCIKAEAEAASDAVLLAAHQPMPLLRRDEGSGVESQVWEHDLLEAFLSDDLPHGTLLMPITGPSGAGKSHLIRWLAAQLGRDPRARQMHVIRIPKSASLRDVVEQVLEPLSDDPRYAEVRKSLDNAIAQVTPFEAAVRFSAELAIALNGLTNRLMAALRSNPSADEARALRVRANHATKLPGFLRDAALSEHMTNHVLAPIVQRAVSGRTEPDPEGDELMPQFRADDLRIPDGLRNAIGQAARPVQSYYQTGLNRADGAGYEEASRVLNEVVDEAIQRVFQLDKATGGITLDSIVLRVRELLLEQGRELVLLVEDFAALSGIQQVLLSVCIQEAERDGRRVRSRMRTALALTDGYLVGRDTIATRAKHEWVIQPDTENDDVLVRTVELAGAYLNAARWGEESLMRQYEQGINNNEADLTAWISIFEDEPDDRLGAFGTSNRGVPLVPYNREAITELAKRHLRAAGQLRFNPRKIINFILRDILLGGLDAFEQGGFPPAGFQDARVSAPVASWLAAQDIPNQERQRLEALLFYWGGNPGDPSQAQLPQGIFDTFRLQRPTGLAARTRETPRPTEQLDPKRSTPSQLPPTDDRRIAQWREKLEAWTGGTELGQQDANKLRSVLRGTIEKAVPWNSLRLAARRSINLALMIPNARGNPTAGIPVSVAKDHRDPDGELRQSLLAAIRIDLSNGQFDYPEADEDSARVAILVERLVTDLIPQLQQQREREARVLAWMLRKQGRLLGLFRRERLPAFDLELNALRARLGDEAQTPQQQATEPSRWQQLRQEAAGLRPELQQALWERTGCFQGTGNTVFAIDSTLIEFSDSADDLDTSVLGATQSQHLSQFKPPRLAATTRPLVEKLRTLASRLDDLLGEERDKQGLLAGLATLFGALEPVGVWPDPDRFNRNALRRETEAFRNFDLIAQLQEAGPLLDEQGQIDAAADETLERLGRVNLSVIEQAGEFLSRLETFIAAAERAMEAKTGALEGIDPEADAKALEHVLAQMDRDLGTITGDRTE